VTSAVRVAVAWDLIGFDGNLSSIDAGDGPASVRVVGGRALYEAVDYKDGSRRVRLARLTNTACGRLRQINRYVGPDVVLEVLSD
jgi:hypothetical protein